MLLNLNKSNWTNSLKLRDYNEQQSSNVETLKNFAKLATDYNKWIKEETKKTREEFTVASVGLTNPKKQLGFQIEQSLNSNVMDCLGTMLNTVCF
jgi:26S proteasome regulatory subunit N11